MKKILLALALIMFSTTSYAESRADLLANLKSLIDNAGKNSVYTADPFTPKMVQDTRDQISNCWNPPLSGTYSIIKTHITTDKSGNVTKLTVKSNKVFHPAEISEVKEAVKCAGPLPLKDTNFILEFNNGFLNPEPEYEIVMFVIAIIK